MSNQITINIQNLTIDNLNIDMHPINTPCTKDTRIVLDGGSLADLIKDAEELLKKNAGEVVSLDDDAVNLDDGSVNLDNAAPSLDDDDEADLDGAEEDEEVPLDAVPSRSATETLPPPPFCCCATPIAASPATETDSQDSMSLDDDSISLDDDSVNLDR